MTPEEEKKVEAAMPPGYFQVEYAEAVKPGDLWWNEYRNRFEELKVGGPSPVGRDETIIRPIEGYNSVIPEDAEERKKFPLQRGLWEYFPDGLALVARLSERGNSQHHPTAKLHWDREKSMDHLDAWHRHNVGDIKAKTHKERLDEKTRKAWRSLADLQDFIDNMGMYKR